MRFLSVCLTVVSILCRDMQAFSVTIIRDPVDVNMLTISCRIVLDISNPVFLLNGTNLQNILGYGATGTSLIFVITRKLEGDYSCGSDEADTGTSVMIISRPQALQLQNLSPMVEIAINGTATIPPLVSPGKLVQWYHIDWRDATTSQTIASIQGPRVHSFIDPSERFSVNPDTFALTITPVRFEDRGSYMGVVGVWDPAGSSLGTYFQTELTNITLEVYVPISFEESPEDKVVQGGGSANFTCRVKGYPIPEVTWYHNGKEVEGTTEKYTLSELTEATGVTVPVVEGTLTILDLISFDSGTVTCVAASNRGQSDQRNAQLSVLGELAGSSTFITTTERVILRVSLVKALAAEVQLFIQYTQEGSGKKLKRTATTRYSQTTEITCFDDSVPFKQFTVAMALVSPTGIRSELHKDSRTYDTSKPTNISSFLDQIHNNFHTTFVLIGGILGSIILIGIIILIVIVCSCICLYCKLKKKNLKTDNQFETIIEILSKRDPQQNSDMECGPPRISKAKQTSCWQSFKRIWCENDRKTNEAYEEIKSLLQNKFKSTAESSH